MLDSYQFQSGPPPRSTTIVFYRYLRFDITVRSWTHNMNLIWIQHASVLFEFGINKYSCMHLVKMQHNTRLNLILVWSSLEVHCQAHSSTRFINSMLHSFAPNFTGMDHLRYYLFVGTLVYEDQKRSLFCKKNGKNAFYYLTFHCARHCCIANRIAVHQKSFV